MTDDVIANPPADLAARVGQQLIHDEGWKPDPRDGPEKDWKLNPAKEGADYDDCPRPECGNRDVDPLYRIANRSTTYQCSCCGTAWNRESAEGHEHNVAVGLGAYSAARQMRGAQRLTFVPSRAYQNNYDRAFQKGVYAKENNSG